MEMAAIQKILDSAKAVDDQDMRREQSERNEQFKLRQHEDSKEMSREQMKQKNSTPTAKSTSGGKTKSQSGKANG